MKPPADMHGPELPRPPAESFRVAYLMSRFPKITETFVLGEMVEMKRLGVDLSIFPLILERVDVRHPDVDAVADDVVHRSLASWALWGGNLLLLLTRPWRYLSTLARVIGANWRSRRFLLGALGSFPKAARYARDARQLGVDHVHAHFASHPAMAAWVVHRLSGIPYSFTAHGSDLHMDQTALDLKIADASFVVMVSDYNRRFVLERLGDSVASKLEISRCGVALDVFSEKPSRDAVSERVDRPFRVLAIAALREVKGHRYLLEACRRLKEKGIALECRLAGDGPLADTLRELVREEGLEDVVEWLGALPRPRILEELAAADVCALTSIQDRHGRREGIPVSLMEAMASGVPVVASLISGIPELVEDGVEGLLTEPKSAESIAAALETLQESAELRTRLGAAGRAKVERHYDLARNVGLLAARMRQGRAS